LRFFEHDLEKSFIVKRLALVNSNPAPTKAYYFFPAFLLDALRGLIFCSSTFWVFFTCVDMEQAPFCHFCAGEGKLAQYLPVSNSRTLVQPSQFSTTA
jgi:hypothetical protein